MEVKDILCFDFSLKFLEFSRGIPSDIGHACCIIESCVKVSDIKIHILGFFMYNLVDRFCNTEFCAE